MAIKIHPMSLASYRYLQGLDCKSQTHIHTLDKLYASFSILDRILSPLFPRNEMLSLKWMKYMSNRNY